MQIASALLREDQECIFTSPCGMSVWQLLNLLLFIPMCVDWPLRRRWTEDAGDVYIHTRALQRTVHFIHCAMLKCVERVARPRNHAGHGLFYTWSHSISDDQMPTRPMSWPLPDLRAEQTLLLDPLPVPCKVVLSHRRVRSMSRVRIRTGIRSRTQYVALLPQ